MLVWYCDVDYAKDKIERKSTSGNCILVIIWYQGLGRGEVQLFCQH